MIINPKSGKAGSKNKILDACEIFSNADYLINIYFTKERNDAYNYIKSNGSKYDIVLVAGGDGTMSEVCNAMMSLKKKPQLSYFPSGTMNDFGTNFDLGNDYIEIANRIIKEKIKPFDICKFNNQYFNYVAGFGAFTDVSYKTKRQAKEALGSLAYILEGLGSISNLGGIKTKIKIGRKEEEIDVLFGIIFSGNRVAGNEFVNKHASINDGIVNVLLVEYTPNIFEYPNYLALISQSNNKYLHWYKGSELNLEFDHEVNWTLDGEEVNGPKKVKIEVINKALEMLC